MSTWLRLRWFEAVCRDQEVGGGCLRDVPHQTQIPTRPQVRHMNIIKVTLMSILNDNIAAAGDSEHNDVHQRQQILIKDNNDTDQTKRQQMLSFVPLLRPLLATALGLRRPPV